MCSYFNYFIRKIREKISLMSKRIMVVIVETVTDYKAHKVYIILLLIRLFNHFKFVNLYYIYEAKIRCSIYLSLLTFKFK